MEQFALRMRNDIEIIKQKQSCVISLAQYICGLVSSHLGLEDRILALNVSVPGHCLHFTCIKNSKTKE